MHVSCRSSRARAAVVAAGMALLVVTATSAAATGALWNIARVGAPVGADGVLIAVVDSGVDAAHPAFGGRVVAQKDFTGDGKQGDPHGHGTHVAGTAAGGILDCGRGPNAIGVAPTARLLSVRVLDARGRGYYSAIGDGIRYAADQGAAVINLSLGDDITIFDGGSQNLLDAVEYAWSKGSIPVLAAGNAHLVGGVFGSGYGDVPAVVVTATTRQDRKASYATSVGSARWGIAAPGGDGSRTAQGDIVSAWPANRCATAAGTSMAAPHVSGALAVLRAEGMSQRAAVDRILATARPVGPESTYGAGLLDLAAARQSPTPTTTPPPPTEPSSPAPAPAPGPSTGDGPPPTEPANEPLPLEAGPSASGPTPAEAPPATVDRDGGDEPASSQRPDPDDGTTSTDRDAEEDEEEAASGASVVRDEGDENGVPAPLVLGAGVALVGLWVLSGRAVLGLRR